MKLNNTDFIIASEERFNEEVLVNVPEYIDTNAFELETEERQIERLDHLARNVSEPIELAKERIMGRNDLMSINYLQLGYLASFPVCRIHVRNANGGNEGTGTGFMISPSLLITNNHVIEEHDFALKSLAEFNYQYDASGKPASSYFFELQPERFFKTNPDLDYTVVAVNPLSVNKDKKLREFGYLKLHEEPGKALITEHLSIIQHPGGGYKQIALRENRLMSVIGNFVTYSTDTTQGSSGSCVFNDQWQVIALHHSGVPRKDAQGRWLMKDGSLWQKGMDDNLIDWISNEGIRISVIVADLKNTHGGSALYSEMINAPGITPEAASKEVFITAKQPPVGTATPPINAETGLRTDKQTNGKIEETTNIMSSTDNRQHSLTVTIPIEVTVKIGNPGNTQVEANKKPDMKTEETGSPFEIIKPAEAKYKGRNGYDPDFVKTDNFKIELFDLLEGQESKLAPLLNSSADNRYILKYFNFSVILHKSRRLSIITAVNIDGNKSDSLGRENTPWILDPRIDEKYQTGPPVYYKNDLDRGHMVRRLDPVWGANAEQANEDTFNFTNSAPQHKNLNQKEWLRLEDFILGNADKENIKVSVFTGPIFSEDDIPYRDVLLPMRFYKVAAMIKSDGTPSVTGYILSQPAEIDDFKDMEGIKETGFAMFKTYQVPIAKIAALTGLRFDKFIQYDPLGKVDPNESTQNIEITDFKDIKI